MANIHTDIFKQTHDDQGYQYVSLGSNCSIAYNLNLYKKRTQSYPFDWCKIKLNQLVDVLEADFSDYTNVQKKKFSENHKLISVNKIECEGTYILKNKYNIEFAHELTKLYETDKFKSLIDKRIERFNNLTNPIFIRLEQNKVNVEQYKKLYDHLEKKFKSFKLVVISNTSIDYKNIINYKICEFKDWRYLNFNWLNMFEEISK